MQKERRWGELQPGCSTPTFSYSSKVTVHSAGTLTGWPWPIFHAPLTLTPCTSPFHKAFNHQTLYSTSSRCIDLTGTLTWWPWPALAFTGLPSLQFSPVTYIWQILRWCLTMKWYSTIPWIMLQWLLHILRQCSTLYDTKSQCWRYSHWNGTGLEYMCPTWHFVYIFFNPVFQVSTAKNEINLFNNHILIVAPVTFAPAGAMTPSAEFLW